MKQNILEEASLIILFIVQRISAQGYGPIRPPTIPCSGNSSEVHSCLHTYLERDIADLHGMVYPHSGSKCDGSEGRKDVVRGGKHLLEVPMLVDHCSKIWKAYECLFDQLRSCRAIIDFFNLRHLLYSLNKGIRWFCGGPLGSGPESSDGYSHREAHYHFPALLESVHCVECFRLKDIVKKTCVRDKQKNWIGDIRLWPKILRMEVGAEICTDFVQQSQCFAKLVSESLPCQQNVTAYAKLLGTFLEPWCKFHPLRESTANPKLVPHYSVEIISTLVVIMMSQRLI